MWCIKCGAAAITERPERTARGYRRFRCRRRGKQFNERSSTVLNRAQYPSDVVALVVLWRLRDLPEMFALHDELRNHLRPRGPAISTSPPSATDCSFSAAP